MGWARVKRILLSVHRWAGLILAPVFVVILLSGAVLAFRPILDDLGPAEPLAAAVDPAAVVRLLDTVDPEGKASIAITGETVVVSAGRSGPKSAYDLTSGRAVAVPAEGFDLFGFTEMLHRSLLIGAGLLVEIASYIMVALILIGPLLAWPRLRNTVLGWHMGLGWWLFPVVLLTPLTGVLMALHVGAPASPPAPAGAAAQTPARAIAQAAREVDLSHLVAARPFRGGSVMITSRTASGEVLHMVTADRVAAVDPDAYVVRALHLGTWAGAWSGGLNLVSALALLGLTGTGLWSWAARRRAAGAAPQDAAADILVAFASQTGTAARLARASAARLTAGGERATSGALAAIDPATLPRYRVVLIIAATTGDGAVPDPAVPFLKALSRHRAEGASFALLGLGDRRYPRFCAGAETLRDALIAAGAREAMPMARADGAPEGAWERWLAEAAGRLGLASGDAPPPEADRPLALTLTTRTRLDSPGDPETKEAWHVVLTSEAPLDHRAGDLLLVTPAPGAPARCYSIGSSSIADPHRISLTVGLNVWTDEAGNTQLGAASGLLCRTLPLGASLEAALRRHDGFHLPDDPARPVIMIATGCGIAPFIGFLAEMDAGRLGTPAWLIFGNRRATGDFFHHAELADWRARGVLARLDTAFSRDAADGAYVQDRMAEQGAELARWLIERDAALYVCGRASTLRTAVDTALAEILVAHAGFSRADAEVKLESWTAAHKIRRDLFD